MFDALQTTRVIAKKVYQTDPEEYVRLFNSITVEGCTPIMIAIESFSRMVTEQLLNFGGIDIHQIDCLKKNAYDIAVEKNNESARKQLLAYEEKCQQQIYLNDQ